MKKKFIFTLIFMFLIFVLIFLTNIVYTAFLNKLSFENYIQSVANRNNNNFTIDKIVLFSSCSSNSVINQNNTTTINDLSQYTDIAIFLNSSTNEFSMNNTLKSVSIKNITFNKAPLLGNPNLYYKGLTDFAKPNISEDNKLTDSLSFDISSDDEIDYSEPILFNNCANPITLSYVNSNIKNNYTVTSDDNSLVQDGSLLKRCNVLLNDLSCSLSFSIFIENNLGDTFICPVNIDIPFEDSSSSIYNGNYTYTYNPNYNFYSNG